MSRSGSRPPRRRPDGFVPLTQLARRAPDPTAVLAEIRQIYFRTARDTIEHDFAHALALLRSLPDEDTREKAGVFMEGLAEMRREWEKEARRGAAPPTGGRTRRTRR
jgi:hypothetical protein